MLIQYTKPELITARFHHRTQLQSQCPCNYTGLISDSIISSFLALQGTVILVKFHNISLSKWKRFKERKGFIRKGNSGHMAVLYSISETILSSLT